MESSDGRTLTIRPQSLLYKEIREKMPTRELNRRPQRGEQKARSESPSRGDGYLRRYLIRRSEGETSSATESLSVLYSSTDFS